MGLHAGSLEKGRHSLSPKTAKLLVKGEGEIERLAELTGTGLEFWGHGQRHGKKSLHIHRAAPMETSVRAAQAERVLRPAGGIGRHHIEMPRQKHPAFGLRADAGKQVEPVAVLMRVSPAGDAMAGEIGFYMTCLLYTSDAADD